MSEATQRPNIDAIIAARETLNSDARIFLIYVDILSASFPQMTLAELVTRDHFKKAVASQAAFSKALRMDERPVSHRSILPPDTEPVVEYPDEQPTQHMPALSSHGYDGPNMRYTEAEPEDWNRPALEASANAAIDDQHYIVEEARACAKPFCFMPAHHFSHGWYYCGIHCPLSEQEDPVAAAEGKAVREMKPESLQQPAPPEIKTPLRICSHCDSIIPDDMEYCPNCGECYGPGTSSALLIDGYTVSRILPRK